MPGALIELTNPTSGDWDRFIEQNAETSGAAAYMRHFWAGAAMPPARRRLHYARAPKPPRTAVKNGGVNREVVICGAGPSLATHWHEYLAPGAGLLVKPGVEVWAANSALTWLIEQGAHVTHGIAIDQTDGLLAEWASAPRVQYYLASSVNPALVQLLCERGIVWFHNFVGAPREAELYRTIWPTSVMVGDGLNAVNRAVCLARFMGFRVVTVLGADCAMRGDVLHANGDGATAHGATPVIMEGVVNGREWRTKPDMLFSAVALAREAVKNPRVRLVGDTFPNALIEEYRANHTTYGEWDRWLEEKVASLKSMRAHQHHRGVAPKGRHMRSEVFAMGEHPS